MAKKTSKREIEITPFKHKLSKSELAEEIAERLEDEEISKKQVKLVLEELVDIMRGAMHPKGVGEFTLHGALKLIRKKYPKKILPAIKKGTPYKNPFTGKTEPHKGRKETVKPAHFKVKPRAMAGLKAAVEV